MRPRVPAGFERMNALVVLLIVWKARTNCGKDGKRIESKFSIEDLVFSRKMRGDLAIMLMLMAHSSSGGEGAWTFIWNCVTTRSVHLSPTHTAHTQFMFEVPDSATLERLRIDEQNLMKIFSFHGHIVA